MVYEVVSNMTFWAATMYLWAMSLKEKAEKVILEDHVPVFKICWTAQFPFEEKYQSSMAHGL